MVYDVVVVFIQLETNRVKYLSVFLTNMDVRNIRNKRPNIREENNVVKTFED